MNLNSYRQFLLLIVILMVLSVASFLLTGCSSTPGIENNPLPKGGPQVSPRHPPGDVNSNVSPR